jgi:hypothetical protein
MKYKPDPSGENTLEWVMRQFWRISAGLTELADSIALGSEGKITVEDEGTPLAATANTLNFVGAGVDATGTGETKTITIPGGGGGFSGLGLWRYRTAITSTPSTGQLQFDNLTIDSATELYIHKTNDAGTDMSAFLDLLASGNIIYVQVQSDATQFVIVQIGTPALAANVYTFPITNIEAQGTAPTNNTPAAVVVELGGSGGSTITVEDEGSPLTTAADTLNFAGGGVDATGAGTTKLITIGNDYLNKDTTSNVSVGYTTDVDTLTFADPLVPVITLEHFKTTTVTSNFDLGIPTGGNGHCEIYISATGTGPYTLTPVTNVVMMDAFDTITVGENYILNIHVYSATNVVAQLQQIP